MKGSLVLPILLLALVAVGHIIRLLLSLELSIGGYTTPLWWSAPAGVLFGTAAFLLWRDRRTDLSL